MTVETDVGLRPLLRVVNGELTFHRTTSFTLKEGQSILKALWEAIRLIEAVLPLEQDRRTL